MKNIFSGLILLSAITLGSCYEDKGNYSYHFEDINSVDTLSFTPEAYSGLNGWMIDYMKTGEADTTTERVTVNPTFSAPDKANEMEYSGTGLTPGMEKTCATRSTRRATWMS